MVAQKIHRPRKRVRVKRCGKSAPRPWQHGWQAKPRTEQDQIGWPSDRISRFEADGPSVESPGRSLEPVSDDGIRGMVVTLAVARRKASEGGGQNSAYGSLRHFHAHETTRSHPV